MYYFANFLMDLSNTLGKMNKIKGKPKIAIEHGTNAPNVPALP